MKISAWVTAKLEEKEYEKVHGIKYQSIVALHGTLQSWVASMEQEQKAQETKTK